MAIEAIGARSQMMLPPAQQARESANSQDVQAGSIQAAPETEQTATQGQGNSLESYVSGDHQSRMQQFLSKFEESVTSQVQQTREDNKITEILSVEEIDRAEATFKADVQSIRDRTQQGTESPVDVDFVSKGVFEAVNKLARSLKFSLEGVLPSVPPEPPRVDYPPEVEMPEVGAMTPDEILSGGLDERA